MSGFPDPFGLIILLLVVSLVPFMVVMITSFVKLIVVLLLMRNALGVQEVPPNLVLYGIALVFTLFITAPVLGEIRARLETAPIDLQSVAGWQRAAEEATTPIREFLLRFADIEERGFFLQATRRVWPERAAEAVSDTDLMVIVPAFVISELTRAFEMGFLLWLPFIAIDLIMANILLSLGMIMVSPVMISLPFKLLLFVLVDGWSRLLHGLVLSYGIPS